MLLLMQPGCTPSAGLQELATIHCKRSATGKPCLTSSIVVMYVPCSIKRAGVPDLTTLPSNRGIGGTPKQ